MGQQQSVQAEVDFNSFLRGLFEFLPFYIESWREIEWTSRRELLDKTREFNSGSSRVPKLNLLLVGAVGSGKSSFCNTIDTIFKGRISGSQEAMSSTSGAASITRKFRILKPGGRRGGEVGFNICDTMGMERDDGLALDDLVYVLDGNLPDGFRFSASSRITPRSPGFIPHPRSANRMHCMAYVVDGTKVCLAPGEIRQTFTSLHKLASARGMAIVVLVTHIDEISSASIRNAYCSRGVWDVVHRITRLVDIPSSRIFLVKNYCTETETNADIDVLNLTALHSMLELASQAV